MARNGHLSIELDAGQTHRAPLTLEEQTRKRIADGKLWFIDHVVGPAALGSAVISLFFIAWLFIGIAGWQNILPAIGTAIVYTACLAGLPALTGMFPRESEALWTAWLGCLAVGVLAFGYYVMSQEAWNAPVAMPVFTGNSGAAARLSLATGLPEGAVLKLGWLVVGISIMAVSGLAGRYYVLGHEIALQGILGDSTSQQTASTPMQVLTLAQQADVFGQWLECNVGKGGRMFVKKAYESYQNVCLGNSTPAMSEDAFSKELKRMCDASNGGIRKIKSNGLMGYDGMHLLDAESSNVIDVQSEPVLLKKPA